MKHQVALNAYELDVFSIAGLGGFARPAKNRGGSAPQPNRIFFEKFSTKIRKNSPQPT